MNASEEDTQRARYSGSHRPYVAQYLSFVGQRGHPATSAKLPIRARLGRAAASVLRLRADSLSWRPSR